MSPVMSGYVALGLAIKYPEATINNALFAVGMGGEEGKGWRNTYRKKKKTAPCYQHGTVN